jgi:hypothetical protein
MAEQLAVGGFPFEQPIKNASELMENNEDNALIIAMCPPIEDLIGKDFEKYESDEYKFFISHKCLAKNREVIVLLSKLCLLSPRNKHIV